MKNSIKLVTLLCCAISVTACDSKPAPKQETQVVLPSESNVGDATPAQEEAIKAAILEDEADEENDAAQ